MRVIFLCSGLGERMKPLTNKYPKSMIPVPMSFNPKIKVPGIINTADVLKRSFEDQISRMFVVCSPDYFAEYSEYLNSINSELSFIINDKDPSVYNNQSSLNCYFSTLLDDGEDLMIVEGDIYLKKSFTSLVSKVDPDMSNYFCNYRYNEWVFYNQHTYDFYKVAKGQNGLAMSGVSIIRNKDLKDLKLALKEVNKDDFWDTALINSRIKLNLINSRNSIVECDTISDLINNDLLTPFEIASLLSEDNFPEKTSGMTNEAFLIKTTNGKEVVRFPGKGTDKFINRSREKYCTDLAGGLTPCTRFYKDTLKVTEFVDKAHTMRSSDEDMTRAVKLIKEYHKRAGCIDEESFSRLSVDLIKELQDYKDIYAGSPCDFPENFREMSEVFEDFIVNNQHNELVLCHRDMDPGNILISEDESQDYLLDFEYAGLLNRYWDWGALVSEHELYFKKDCTNLICELVPEADKIEILKWSVIVDYVWSVWTLAKIHLGDDLTDYLNERWSRACRVAKETGMI